MPTFNDPTVNTAPVVLEEFEINPATVSNVTLQSTERHYQVSNLITQDKTRTGILQFFPTQFEEPAASSGETDAGETSMRPDREGGSYGGISTTGGGDIY